MGKEHTLASLAFDGKQMVGQVLKHVKLMNPLRTKNLLQFFITDDYIWLG